MTIFVLAVAAVLIGIDQLIKAWVVANLVASPSVTVIPGLLQLTYVENRGAAFGIFQGNVEILSILTLVVIAGLIFAVIKGVFQNKLVLWSIGLVIAGGLGNLVDRLFRTYVVDYLDVSPLFSFPVFNFADCCVVIGTGILLVYLLFFEEREKNKKRPPEEEKPVG